MRLAWCNINKYYFGFITILLAGCVASNTSSNQQLNRQDWLEFQHRFIETEGRVIDTGNGGVSHSEGQGIAMLLAVTYDDQKAFARLWHWTQQHLQIRDDKLLVWRWILNDEPHTLDKNNASDGDIFVAWALLRAANSWNIAEYKMAANQIIEDIKNKLLIQSEFGLVMLPGSSGFEQGDTIVVNLSYWIFPAFIEFNKRFPDSAWTGLRKTGNVLLQKARFGRWHLPADWIRIQKKSVLMGKTNGAKNSRFSYDAIRIPLYIVWGNRNTNDLLSVYQDFWNYFQGAVFLPAWTDLKNNSIDSYDAPAGFYAIKNLVEDITADEKDLGKTFFPIQWNKKPNYYSASLQMLVNLARSELRAYK